MRIGLFIEHYDRGRGGAEQWTARFVDELLARGHEVHVAAQSFTTPTHNPRFLAHPIEPARSRLALAEAAEQVFRSMELDIVHDMGGGYYCDVFQPHGGSRTAAIQQNLYLIPRWLQPLKRRLWDWLPRYREFAALVARQYVDDGRVFLALSQRVAGHFQEFHGVQPEQIRVIYNGVDCDHFCPEPCYQRRSRLRAQLGVDGDTLLLLIVAHNFRLKGVPALLAALRQLIARGRKVRLVVAGGRRLAGWLRTAAALEVQDAVSFTGPVADPRPLYAAADVYVQPTFYDPCSLVVLEALACGLPVVTTQANGASELLTNGQEGFVLESPTEIEALTEYLEALSAPDLRAHMSQAARQLALAHSFARNVNEILAVYRDRLRQGRRAA